MSETDETAVPAAPSEEAEFVGLPARADLLPGEVRGRLAVRAARRLALLVLVLALVVVAAGGVGAGYLAFQARVGLETEQARTATLQAKQAEFGEVKGLQQRAKAIESVDQVTTATVITWSDVLRRLSAGLPAGTVLQDAAFTAQSPVVNVSGDPATFAVPRIGDLTITAVGPDAEAITRWIDGLAGEPAFSAASTYSATNQDGSWRVPVTVYLSPSLTALPEPEEDAG